MKTYEQKNLTRRYIPKYKDTKASVWQAYKLVNDKDVDLGEIYISKQEIETEMDLYGIVHHEPCNIAKRKALELAMATAKEGEHVRVWVKFVRYG